MKKLAVLLTLIASTFLTHTEVFANDAMVRPQELSALETQIQELEWLIDGGLSGTAPDPQTQLLLKEQLAELYAQREVRGDRNPLDQGTDTCPGAPLFGLPVVVSGTTTGYADNHAPYASCGSTAAEDVVYSFVPSHTLTYTITTEGSSYDTYLYVIGGGPCPGSTQVGCDDDGGPGTTSLITVTLNGGVPYYIYVDGWSGSDGNYVLTIRDNCEVTCQPGDLIECAEVRAPGHELNDCNGACNNMNGTPTWQQIFPYQTVCGRTFTYIGSDNLEWRDMDIYRFTVTEACSLRLILTSEVSMRMAVLTDNCPWSIVYEAPLWQYPCSTVTYMTPCLQPGDYNLWIAPPGWNGINDYREYRLRVETVSCGGCVVENTVVAPGQTNGLTCFDSTYCNRTNNPADVVAVVIPYDGSWKLTLCGDSGPWDSFLVLSESCCGGPIASNDDVCGSEGVTAEIGCTSLNAGTYYLTVTGYAPFGCGYYELTVSECSGACCYGDFGAPSCAQTTLTECDALQGLFRPEQICGAETCPPRPGCQNNSMLSQYPNLPSELWDFWISDYDESETWCDNYSVDGPIGSIRFWGFEPGCDGADKDFSISFFDGVNQSIYSVSAAGTQYPEYVYFSNYILTEYTAFLNPSCAITSGELSVANIGQPECVWAWLTSTFGDNQGPCGGWDFSFCLAPPVPCAAVDSLTILFESENVYSVSWWQAEAGQIQFWISTDPNGEYPAGYTHVITMPFPAGINTVPAFFEDPYLKIILVHDCSFSASSAVPPQTGPQILRFGR